AVRRPGAYRECRAAPQLIAPRRLQSAGDDRLRSMSSGSVRFGLLHHRPPEFLLGFDEASEIVGEEHLKGCAGLRVPGLDLRSFHRLANTRCHPLNDSVRNSLRSKNSDPA